MVVVLDNSVMGAENIIDRFGDMAKTAESLNFSDALDVLWVAYGQPGDLEKNAAAEYFYNLKKPVLDLEAFGSQFCKLSSVVGYDPWALACEVEDHLDAYRLLSKTASDPQTIELAQFYVNWADGIEKDAFLPALGRLAGRAVGAMKKIPGAISRVASGGKKAITEAAAGAAATVKNAPAAVAKNVRETATRTGGAYRQAANPTARQARRATARKAMANQKPVAHTPGTARNLPGSPAAARQQASQAASSQQQQGLKQRLIQKRQAAGQSLPSQTQRRMRTGGFTTGQKVIGGVAIGAPIAGGAYLYNKATQQQPQGAYYG